MGIHKLADVHPGAQLHKDVSIGAFTQINNFVSIGEQSEIGSHCALGVETPLAESNLLSIGNSATIRSHSIIYSGSTIGDFFETGHHVSVREKLTAGNGLLLGSFCDVQGHASFGDYVKIYNGAHIARHTKLGNFVWIFPYVVFTNDPTPPSDGFEIGSTVQDYAVLATRATVMPGITIGSDSFVGAGSLVTKDVEPGSFYAGSPAKRVASSRHIQLRDGSGPAYPWRRHFHRGMPNNVVEKWKEEFK